MIKKSLKIFFTGFVSGALTSILSLLLRRLCFHENFSNFQRRASIQNLEKYFGALLPHGYFEFPAIILSGSIGLEIAGRAIYHQGDLEVLLVVGGVVESW